MKILQIISNLGNGGAEKFTIELSNELAKNNEVTLITFRDIDEEMIFPKLINTKVQLLQLAKKSGFSLKIYFQLFRIFFTKKPDVIHFHLDSTFKYVFPFVFLFPKIKFIYTIHCNIIESNRKIFTILNQYLKNHNRVQYVCISSSIYHEFSKSFQNIYFNTIENGLQLYENKEVEKELSDKFLKSHLYNNVFIAVGRISLQKNYVLLMNTISKFPFIKVNIVADLETADKEYYRELLTIKPKNVEFIGKSDKVIELMQLSDAFIMSSSFEGMPISALEAMSIGLPIITTPCGGMIDLIENNVSGWISEDFSEDEFAKIIKNFLFSPIEKVENISKNNKWAYNERYTMKKCAENYYKLYKND